MCGHAKGLAGPGRPQITPKEWVTLQGIINGPRHGAPLHTGITLRDLIRRNVKLHVMFSVCKRIGVKALMRFWKVSVSMTPVLGYQTYSLSAGDENRSSKSISPVQIELKPFSRGFLPSDPLGQVQLYPTWHQAPPIDMQLSAIDNYVVRTNTLKLSRYRAELFFF